MASIATIVVLFSAPLAGVDLRPHRLAAVGGSHSLPGIGGPVSIFPFRVSGWQITAVMVVQGLAAGAIATATFAAAPEVMRKPQWAGLGAGRDPDRPEPGPADRTRTAGRADRPRGAGSQPAIR